MPARGIGLHALVVAENEALRLTQDEVEEHPGWRGYAESTGKHPPLRGLRAVPIVGEDGLNYGSCKCLTKWTAVTSTPTTNGASNASPTRPQSEAAGCERYGTTLDQPAPAAPLDVTARFVVIENA